MRVQGGSEMSSRKVDVEASEKIISLASKFMVISVLAVAVGMVSMTYVLLLLAVFGLSIASIEVVLGIFIGVAFIVIGFFLNFWGLFWLRNEGKRLRPKSAKRK
jgi:hypothetical protein